MFASRGGGGGGFTLDTLSAPALASLHAAWWTKRLLTSYAGTLYDATHLYDQSGNAKTITSGASIGTTTEGADTALVFDPLVPNTFTRGDALGLAADPALTIVVKLHLTATSDQSLFPTVLTIGTAGTAEIEIYFQTGNPGAQQVNVSNFNEDGGVAWNGTFFGAVHTMVFTKPAASGYSNTWRMSIDGGALQSPSAVSSLGISLGATETQLGDYSGGGYPFDGRLVGQLVFNSVLTGADLALVQAL